jgi:hypothetical protein
MKTENETKPIDATEAREVSHSPRLPCSAAVYMWDGSGLNVAIPKRRGKGYLKTPYGNHLIERIEDARDELDCVDFDGLDGYLTLEYGMVTDSVERDKIADKALPVLARAYGFSTWREDRNHFWAIVQNIDMTPFCPTTVRYRALAGMGRDPKRSR